MMDTIVNVTKQHITPNPHKLEYPAKQVRPREKIPPIGIKALHKFLRTALVLTNLEIIRRTAVNLKEKWLIALCKIKIEKKGVLPQKIEESGNE